MRVLVLHNPTAGCDDSDDDRLIREIERSGHAVEVHTSRKAWKAALAREPDLAVAIGGDGTVGKVARALAGRHIPIAVLPMGTANNVAGTLGLVNRDPSQLIAGWKNAARRPFDLGIARAPWGEYHFLESVGIGLLSEAIQVIDEGPAQWVNDIGETATRINAAVEVFRHTLHDLSAAPVELRIDGEAVSGAYLLVEVLNFGAAGPNLNFVPHGDPSDGFLDVVLAEEADRHRLRERLDQYREDPMAAPVLRTHRARRIELRCAGCLLHVDDELQRAHERSVTVDITIEHGALTFLIPEDRSTPAEAGPAG